MKRTLLTDLNDWLGKEARKPLIIRGARQVGKTWIVREFARLSDLKLIEINFERSPEQAELFKNTSPAKVIASIERQTGLRVEDKKTLLFLDEIQKAPQAFANLRWFYEERPELAIIATGSLLDFVLRDHEFSMPVGRISYMFMEPMSFKEFLIANNEDIVVRYIESFKTTDMIEEPLHDKLIDYFRDYLLVGGLPSAVQSWLNTHSPVAVSEIHQNLANTYMDDFNKYAGRIPTARLEKIFRSVPRMLGKKFKFANVDNEERSAALKQALDMLCMARICHKVVCSYGHGIPLAAEENTKIFKVVFLDVGLTGAVLGINLMGSKAIEDMTRINEGGLSEQVVGQMLRTLGPSFVDPVLHYYTKEQKGSEAELDYLLQIGPKIVPVEVKSGSTGRLRSLHQFMAERRFSLAIRLCPERPSVASVDIKTVKGDRAQFKLLSIPFYLASEILRLSQPFFG